MGATYLVEKQGRTYWSKQKGKFGISVTESQLIEYVEYLIDNIFTRIKNIKTENVTRCRDSRSAKSIETM